MPDYLFQESLRQMCRRVRVSRLTVTSNTTVQITTRSLGFLGFGKIVACSHSSSQCLLVSTVLGMLLSLHPTSFLMIFILSLVYYNGKKGGEGEVN